MTIDEAIECERNHRLYPEYHEQIAEWLELLKWYEQGMEDIPCESGVLPEDVYHAGYNKAIDDFVHECDKCCGFYTGNNKNLTREDILNIAEQLKAGGKNVQKK